MASLSQDARPAGPASSDEEYDEEYVGRTNQELDDPSPDVEEAGRETSEASTATGQHNGTTRAPSNRRATPAKSGTLREWAKAFVSKLKTLEFGRRSR